MAFLHYNKHKGIKITEKKVLVSLTLVEKIFEKNLGIGVGQTFGVCQLEQGSHISMFPKETNKLVSKPFFFFFLFDPQEPSQEECLTGIVSSQNEIVETYNCHQSQSSSTYMQCDLMLPSTELQISVMTNPNIYG